MIYQPASISGDLSKLTHLPTWVTSTRTETLEDVTFLSGAALTNLHVVLSRDDVPQSLHRAHLVMRAAEACVANQGRPERAKLLRDAVAFLQPGEGAGPARKVYLSWLRAVERPVSVNALHRALPEIDADQIAGCCHVNGRAVAHVSNWT